jgi:hypothetical protein
MKPPKTRASGTLTEAGFVAFIRSALRGASLRWRPRWEALNDAYFRDGINPATGRKCKLHRCQRCSALGPKNSMKVDHIIPVVNPSTGFTTWDSFINRLFCEKDNFQILCEDCHNRKTKSERMLKEGTISVSTAAVRSRVRSNLHGVQK